MFCQIFADHACYHCEKKLWERRRGEKRKEKKRKKFVVISGGTLYCRLQRKEPEESGEEEASK